MLALDATPEQVQEWLAGKETKISVAAINGPHSVVVSGDAATIEEVAGLAVGARAKELEVSHAFHSPLMEPILEELHSAASALRTKTPAIPDLLQRHRRCHDKRHRPRLLEFSCAPAGTILSRRFQYRRCGMYRSVRTGSAPRTDADDHVDVR